MGTTFDETAIDNAVADLVAGENVGTHPAAAAAPPWFVDNATAAATGRKLTEFYATANPARLPGLFLSAFRG
ncbi:hypothetical protein OIE68_32110 [Nocardia vinacea]|uniref:hypothetical protein n=1 Tax=Nocardia vinacea TaxID=96468 RepID=UPI002E0F3766|nr:hypothetical protein OIE68_32110 [Nocardia vinacea]